ncbi:hypothetical protein B2J93_149 [Marssonina coronariae]|uniref:Uncharacterized protein n=1 Tax=Diplocarpon coronariae TaxID=2795749 RepID=A0A218Z4N1_9HELO|nr:hypothetical protein B2J93_149 [Marssonina coronariae]
MALALALALALAAGAKPASLCSLEGPFTADREEAFLSAESWCTLGRAKTDGWRRKAQRPQAEESRELGWAVRGSEDIEEEKEGEEADEGEEDDEAEEAKEGEVEVEEEKEEETKRAKGAAEVMDVLRAALRDGGGARSSEVPDEGSVTYQMQYDEMRKIYSTSLLTWTVTEKDCEQRASTCSGGSQQAQVTLVVALLVSKKKEARSRLRIASSSQRQQLPPRIIQLVQLVQLAA